MSGLQPVAADKDMRDEAGAQYLGNFRNAAALFQPHIDNHQVWLQAQCGGHSLRLRRLDAADFMPHVLQHFGQHDSDHRLVLDNQNAALVH